MTDPFTRLRQPVEPVAPDPAFAARLRTRLARALAFPRGVTVSDTAVTPTPTLGAAVPYLAVDDARRAIDWYVEVFGAVADDPIVMPDGRVGHCELRIGGGLLYLADAHPEIGVVAPDPNASAVSLMLGVDDVETVREVALARGATGDERGVYDAYGQRNTWIVDAFGHRWGLHSPVPVGAESSRAPLRQGDVVYAWLRVPDGDRAATFYRDVLGWEPQGGDGRYQVDTVPPVGIGGGGTGTPSLYCNYVVEDLDAALERVRTAGGTAGDAEDRPYGRVADCVDDQGTDFTLYQADPDDERPEPGVGSLTYLTVLVPDSGRYRDFYGAVLGWDFTPGRVEDGWEVVGSTPMTGLAGGQERVQAVPMWEVDDIDAAVERVRAAGGTATDAEQQPYGRMSECTDDQGTPFYLGQTRGQH